MILSSLIGTAIGGATSLVPGIISYLQRKDELRYEAKLAEIRIKYKTEETQSEIDLVNARADAYEGQSLRDHDSSIDDSGFMGGIRASVRPIITYLFFFLYAFVKFFTVMEVASHDNTESIILSYLWTETDMAIFSAIMGFWFGGRVIEKHMRR